MTTAAHVLIGGTTLAARALDGCGVTLPHDVVGVALGWRKVRPGKRQTTAKALFAEGPQKRDALTRDLAGST